MLSLKTKVFLAAALFQVLGYAVGQQPNVASFGDFMEFDIGFHKACENVKGGVNTTWPIVSAFTECTFNLSPKKPTDNFEGMAEICENRGKYFECWDKLRADALKTCGSDKEALLPALYRSTVASLCQNDNAAKRIETFKKAFEEVKPGDENKCPEETGIHWVENCKDLLITMNSADLCARHGAIDKCLQKITCDQIKFATLIRQVYSEGRPHLQCNERRA